MKLSALILTLAACSVYPGDVPTDAHVVVAHADARADATPDAAQQPPAPAEGCLMGNLPDARTVTLGTNDPIPPALLDELQDMHAGDKRKPFSRGFFPTCWTTTGSAPVLVINPAGAVLPVWRIDTAQTVRTRIPYEGGETVLTVSLETYGNGVIDWVGNVEFATDMTGASGFNVASNGGGVINQPAAWQTGGGFVVSGGSVVAANGVLWLELVLSGGTGGVDRLHVGSIHLGLRR